MIVKLLPNQVPKFWDYIKYAVSKSDRIEEKDLTPYLQRLLLNLLNSKAQCFIRYNESRQLQMLVITRFTQNVINGSKELTFQSLYSFEFASVHQWRDDMKLIMEFAKANGCKSISAYSSNPRVFEIVSDSFFSEQFRCFSREIN